MTAEYGMLPRATSRAYPPWAAVGKQGGRTVEIQRLIAEVCAVVDLEALGELRITVDCDVIQADGGTRTASITGGWVALYDCIAWMKKREMLRVNLIATLSRLSHVACSPATPCSISIMRKIPRLTAIRN